MSYLEYRTLIYFRHFRRLGLTALRAWQLATGNVK